MPRITYKPPPSAVIENRLRWFDAVKSGKDADPELLISGLRKGDGERWEIGVLDAKVKRDPEDDSPFIWLKLKKPKKQNPSERPNSERRFDPEAVFLIAAHLFFGGTFGLKYSKTGGYHYVELRQSHKGIRYHRILANARANELSRIVPLGVQVPDEHWHDLRLRNLLKFLPIEQAAAIYDGQQNGPYNTRSTVIELSVSRFRTGVIAGRDTKDAYRAMLVRGYELLDSLRPDRKKTAK